jgi:hypothetical protein
MNHPIRMMLAVKRRQYLTPDNNQYNKKLEIRDATLEYRKHKADDVMNLYVHIHLRVHKKCQMDDTQNNRLIS